MLVADFDFELPEDRIAQAPARPRDSARLLVYDRRDGAVQHKVFCDLPDLLSEDDLLVLNDTRVIPCRLDGRRGTGARVSVLILERTGGLCRGYVRNAAKIRPDEPVPLEDGRLVLRLREGAPIPGDEAPENEAPENEAPGNEAPGIRWFELAVPDREGDQNAALDAVLAEVGRAPLPPYIARDGSEDRDADREQYQTVYARSHGAIAAPTAGLHFTEDLLERIRARGIRIATVTLHVGAGTFAPVRVARVAEHRMHEEWYDLGANVAAEVDAARARGGRVVAVGTTAARTLESCAGGAPGSVVAGSGTTDLFLYPGCELRVVDALVTNFHLPRSTLLMLVAAFAGREEILRVYREAVARGYRFYSYGDAMLIL